jgi:ABC-2 type transport system permease protein
MNAVLALAWLEGKRLLFRSRGYLILTMALPVVLYLAISHQAAIADGVASQSYYMVAMAEWGAFSGALIGQTVRISQERRDGWLRQLRMTALPAGSYVAAKVISSTVATLPTILIMLVLGRFYGGVHLPIWKWSAVGGVVWMGALAFAALAVAIGYRLMPDQAQPLTMLVYFAMTLLGGLWFPLSGLLANIGKALPTYQIADMGVTVITSGTVALTSLAVIVAWIAGFVLLAVLAVRATSET